MKKLYLAGLISLVVVAGCAKLSAMKGPFDGDAINPAFVEVMVDKIDDKLDLQDEQEAELTAIMETMMQCALQLRPESDALKQQIADELRKKTLDEAALEKLMMARMQQFKTIFSSGKKELVRFHGSLNAAQREALAQLALEHGKHGWHGTK